MLRLDATGAGSTSDAWSPEDEVYLQYQGPTSAEVDVLGRVHEDAPWTMLCRIEDRSNEITRLAAVPTMMLRIRRNPTGGQIRIWDNT